MRLFKATLTEFTGYFTQDGKIYDESLNQINHLMTKSDQLKLILYHLCGKCSLKMKYYDRTDLPAFDNIAYIIKNVFRTSDPKIILIDGEEFKNIPDHPNYWINRSGVIYSMMYNKILHHKINRYGYHTIGLGTGEKDGRKWKMIQRLVYYTWTGKQSNPDMDINHLNMDPNNNDLSNLEECTPQENIRHAYLNNGRALWTAEEIDEICKDIIYGKSTVEIYEKFKDKKNISYDGIKELYWHLAHHSKFWKDISSKYNFDDYVKLNRISLQTVEKICELLDEGKLLQKEIAAITGTTIGIVSDIYRGRTYTTISSKYDFRQKGSSTIERVA